MKKFVTWITWLVVIAVLAIGISYAVSEVEHDRERRIYEIESAIDPMIIENEFITIAYGKGEFGEYIFDVKEVMVGDYIAYLFDVSSADVTLWHCAGIVHATDYERQEKINDEFYNACLMISYIMESKGLA